MWFIPKTKQGNETINNLIKWENIKILNSCIIILGQYSWSKQIVRIVIIKIEQ